MQFLGQKNEDCSRTVAAPVLCCHRRSGWITEGVRADGPVMCRALLVLIMRWVTSRTLTGRAVQGAHVSLSVQRLQCPVRWVQACASGWDTGAPTDTRFGVDASVTSSPREALCILPANTKVSPGVGRNNLGVKEWFTCGWRRVFCPAVRRRL